MLYYLEKKIEVLQLLWLIASYYSKRHEFDLILEAIRPMMHWMDTLYSTSCLLTYMFDI